MKIRTAALLLATAAPCSAAAPAPTPDAAIVSSIKASDVFRRNLKDDDIAVASRDGAVVLTGTVFEDYDRTLAQDTAEATPGVVSVENRLTSSTPDRVVDSDPWIAAHVKEIFVFHHSVDAADADISVKDGVVTLTGDAVSERDKAVATSYAREVEGVKSVDNRMTVAGTAVSVRGTVLDKMDDASVTARVKAALLFHRSTGPFKINVKTKDGVVALRGSVGTAADKARIEKFVSDIDGVAAVDDRLTVEP